MKNFIELLIIQQNLNNASCEYFEQTDSSTIRNDIQSAIKNNKGYLAIGVLIYADLDLKKELFDILFENAILGNERVIGISRTVILLITDRNWLRDEINNKIEHLLNSYQMEPGYQYFYYRNIAQLFYELQFSSELQSFLNAYCKNSEIADVFEIYEDYK